MTGRYKVYPEYKESGVSWLEKVPTHWDITKTAWHFVAEKGKNGQVLTNEYIGQNNGDYPVYSGQTGNNGVMGCIDTYEFDTGKEGVLFSTTVGAKAMTLNHLKGKFSLSQNCLIIQKTSPIFNTRFCFYHFQPLFSFERGLIPEHMQASFRMEDLYQYKIALPSFEEQQKIANFLDHETAKIDTLITKQEKLIELLKEKRQAVISHAVTKGLNPDAPMKDSGVEWLGEVPEHWAVGSLRWRISISSGEGLSSNLVEKKTTELKQVPVIGGNGVMGFTEAPNTSRTAIAIGRVGALCGNVHLINYVSWITDNALKVSSWDGFDEYYLVNLLKAANLNDLASKTAQPLITGEQIKSLTVVIPPIEEQVNINLMLTEVANRFDKLERKSVLGIELLRERKNALISAAVTGKIDVRDWEAK